MHARAGEAREKKARLAFCSVRELSNNSLLIVSLEFDFLPYFKTFLAFVLDSFPLPESLEQATLGRTRK